MIQGLKKQMGWAFVSCDGHGLAGAVRPTFANSWRAMCLVGLIGVSAFGWNCALAQTPEDGKAAKPQPASRGKLELKKLPIEIPKLDHLINGLGVNSKYVVQTVKELVPPSKDHQGGIRTTRRIYERASDCLTVESWFNTSGSEINTSQDEKGSLERVLIFDKDAFYSCNSKGLWTKLENFAALRNDLRPTTPYGGAVHTFENLFAAPVLGLKLERIRKGCQQILNEVAANPGRMSLMADQVGKATDLLIALQGRPIRLKDAEMMPMLKMPSEGCETLITFFPDNDRLIQSFALTRKGKLAGTCQNLLTDEVVDKPARPDRISRLLSPPMSQNKKSMNFDAMEKEWRGLPADRKRETLGAVIVPSSKGLKVLHVFPDSNAKIMGLAVGDEIVAVDGAAVNEIPSPMAIRMLVNKNVELTLSNGKKCIKP